MRGATTCFPSSAAKWLAAYESVSKITGVSHGRPWQPAWLGSTGVCVFVYLVLFVLPGVREAGDDGCDTGRRGDLAGVNHDKQLHQVVVDFAAAALHDVHVLAAHALPNLHAVEVTRKDMMSEFDRHDVGVVLHD